MICLGAVIRGGTPHFEFVCAASNDGLRQVALETGVPIGFGLLTCEDEAQALDRAGLATTQTPQAFVAARLRAAHRGAGEATDDAGLLELEGATVRTVPGDPRNLKLTRAEDLVVAEALMAGIDR